MIRPTYAEINLNNLTDNYQAFKVSLKKTTAVLVVVKANAYGHGLVECARHLEETTDVEMFGVATIEEGIALRKQKIKTDILVLGSIFPFASFKYLLEYNLTPTVASTYIASELSKFYAQYKKKVKVHLKIDTGMGRIGFSANLLNNLNFPYLEIEGIYTHVASADIDRESTLKQIADFRAIKNNFTNIKYFHLANTETTFNYDHAEFDMVRTGLSIYGLYGKFKPVMRLKSKVVFLKTVPPNTGISYGKTYITYRTTKVATVAIGYADGYKRILSNRIYATINGQNVRQIGTICMDMCMFDVTDLASIKVGDDIEFINQDITVNKIAELAETIPYEIVTQITSRVPRVFILK
ncbi:MAG: alanine racemase [bacterium]|nr:alanine racemase [bacterium]